MTHTIGEAIEGRLHEMRIQQKELAAVIDVPVSTLNSWLRLGRDIPARHVPAIAACLRVSVNGLLGLAEGDEATKCQWAPGVIIRPDGRYMLDACQYVLAEKYRNVTVEVLRCQVCGHTSVAWSQQADTEDITDEE